MSTQRLVDPVETARQYAYYAAHIEFMHGQGLHYHKMPADFKRAFAELEGDMALLRHHGFAATCAM